MEGVDGGELVQRDNGWKEKDLAMKADRKETLKCSEESKKREMSTFLHSKTT